MEDALHGAEGEATNGTHINPGKRKLSVTLISSDSIKVARKDILSIPIEAAAHYTLNRQATPFQQPVAITSFSYDETRTLHHDDRSRSYYHAPPPRADLNRGFEDLIERDETVNEHLDSLLISLMKLSEKDRNNQLYKANLVTWRGMMTKICTILYEDRQGFEMNAMIVGDTLYLEEHVSVEQRAEKARQQEDSRLKRFGYYGYSFESWTCHKAKHPVNSWDGNVNTNVQWCSIVKTKLGSTRCILAGEVDAVDVETHAPIEVKTSMQIRNMRDEERFESKMLRFYMQSFLLGIVMVVVGFRDHKGYIVTHQEFPTLTMPRLVRGKAHAWDPVACLNLADELLVAIRTHIAANLPSPQPPLNQAIKQYPVHRITYNLAAKTVTVKPLEERVIVEEIKEGKKDRRVGFLLSEYYEMAIKGL